MACGNIPDTFLPPYTVYKEQKVYGSWCTMIRREPTTQAHSQAWDYTVWNVGDTCDIIGSYSYKIYCWWITLTPRLKLVRQLHLCGLTEEDFSVPCASHAWRNCFCVTTCPATFLLKLWSCAGRQTWRLFVYHQTPQTTNNCWMSASLAPWREPGGSSSRSIATRILLPNCS